jgi:putative SOS response-associated peptidase YedK
MCGRGRLPTDYSELKINAVKDYYRDLKDQRRFNVPPTTIVPALISQDGERTVQAMRWGLVPSWSKDGKNAYATFNARADGVDTKPTFRGAWKAGQRCLIITDGFYEWRKSDKQSYAISLGNRSPMLMAGLWDEWRGLKTCTVITTEANAMLSSIHDRMPVIIDSDDWPAWLGETSATPADLKSLLRPFPAERMTLWPVDKKVGNVKNEGPELAEKIQDLCSGVVGGTQ